MKKNGRMKNPYNKYYKCIIIYYYKYISEFGFIVYAAL